MSKTHKISVIIPAYNMEPYLPTCVESVVRQTYPAGLLEIIIVDDGSTDGTGAIADRFAAQYANVSVIHQENGGLSAARNAGIAAATGEYYGFVDSDDYISPQMYETLMDAMERRQVLMAQACRSEVGEGGETLPDLVIPPPEEICISAEECLKELLLHKGDSSFCTKLTHKSLFAGMKFPVGRLNEDFYLLFRMLGKKELLRELVIVPGRYYHVYHRRGSISRPSGEDRDYFPPVYTDIVKNADAVYDVVRERYPQMLDIAVRFGLAQRLDYLLHIPVSRMRRDNEFYRSVAAYVRRHIADICKNPWLSGRERLDLLILAPAPRLVRLAHERVKRRRQRRAKGTP